MPTWQSLKFANQLQSMITQQEKQQNQPIQQPLKNITQTSHTQL